MNILIPDSWLREYLDTKAKPTDIQKCLTLCGPSIERTKKLNGDTVYDIEVTTNRVDCMSIMGIAREAYSILPHFGFPTKFKDTNIHSKINLNTRSSVDYLKTKIDPKLCYRFSAVLIKNVAIKTSPGSICEKLEKVGMRGINNVIDISNLLMHELGQPVHVFDYDQISNQTMTLRASQTGEKITTLDGKTHILPGEDIVIEDGSGNLIDLCGIMGGQNSAVTEKTKNVLLFVQTYSGSHIRKTSMALAHRTSVAVLFEKNLPTEQVISTLQRGIQLIRELAGGETESHILDILNTTEEKKIITLSENISDISSRLSGVKISPKQASSILEALGFNHLSSTKIAVPYFRKNDVTIPEDLVEEIVRIYGYHNLPSQIMTGALPLSVLDKTFYWENKIKTILKYFGFNEIYTYSLVAQTSGLKLSNPLSSDWIGLRTSLFPSHISVIEKNIGKSEKLDFFEIANVYIPNKNGLPKEQLQLIITSTNQDFLKFKGFVEALLSDIGIHNFQPEIKNEQNILYWEISLEKILPLATDKKTYTAISKFTPIIEDVNVSYQGNYSLILKQIKSISPLIKTVKLIDRYKDKLTLRINFHSNEKQLSSQDIAHIRDSIINLH